VQAGSAIGYTYTSQSDAADAGKTNFNKIKQGEKNGSAGIQDNAGE
jgi:hypothetical protein